MPAVYFPRVRRYSVQSETKPKVRYIVDVSHLWEATCTCHDWGFERGQEMKRTGHCKHIMAVFSMLKTKRHDANLQTEIRPESSLARTTEPATQRHSTAENDLPNQAGE
jgi:hypothetical protein